jgi:LEA14-like dessication related protein
LKFQTLSKLILLSLAAFLLTSCTAIRLVQSADIKDPTFKYIDNKVVKVRDNKTIVNLNFEANNPNEIGLKNIFISYELFTEGKRFLKGRNIKIHLPPNSTTKLVVPAEIVYKDVFRALGPVAEKILLKHKELPVLVKLKISGTPTVYNEIEEGAIFSFKLGMNKTIHVPIPHDKIDKAVNKAAKKAKKELDKLKKFF